MRGGGGHPNEFFFPSQPGMAPLLPPMLLTVECEELGSELSGNKRWPMLMPVKSSESPSSATSESEGAVHDDTVVDDWKSFL